VGLPERPGRLGERREPHRPQPRPVANADPTNLESHAPIQLPAGSTITAPSPRSQEGIGGSNEAEDDTLADRREAEALVHAVARRVGEIGEQQHVVRTGIQGCLAEAAVTAPP